MSVVAGGPGRAGEPAGVQLRLTAVAAVATALAALPLWPLFADRRWLGGALAAIAVVALVGAGARAVSAPRFWVLLLQLAGLALLVVAVFAPEHAVLGLLPSAETFHDLAVVVRGGATAINQQSVPLTEVPGVVLLVTVGVGVAAVEVDFTAVACRCPAISGVVLLVMYAVPAAVLPSGAPWSWFVPAAAGWLLLLYVGRREGVRAWGTAVASERGSPLRSVVGSGDPRAQLARRIAAGSLVAGVVLAAVVPGVGEGVVGRLGGGADGSAGAHGAPAAVGLDLSATIRANLQTSRDEPLLRYSAAQAGVATTPQYLRLAVLDEFSGVTWTPATRPADAPSVVDGPQSVPGLDPSAATANVVTDFQPLGNTSGLSYVPMPYAATTVNELDSQWQWDTSTSTVFSSTDVLSDQSYNVTSETVQPSAAQLTTSSAAGAPATDLTVPAGLPATVHDTALRVTAGATSEYAKAVRLQDWFRTEFTYSLDQPPTDSAQAIESFLTVRKGYCQQFAATYALMARSVGVPTRVVVGFTPGTPSTNGSYVVGTHDFHAWPEVWFAGVGWVRFEPTPRVGGDSTVAVPSWSGPAAVAPAPTTGASATATPSPRATQPGRARQPVSEGAVTATSHGWTGSERTGAALLAVLLVLLVAAGPGLARWARSRRRLREPAGPRGVEAAWAELADTARDLGLPWSEDDTPRRSADALVRAAALRGSSAVAVQDLRKEVEQVRYAQTAPPARRTAPGDAARMARRGLFSRSTTAARWRARLLPRTVLSSTARRRRPR